MVVFFCIAYNAKKELSYFCVRACCPILKRLSVFQANWRMNACNTREPQVAYSIYMFGLCAYSFGKSGSAVSRT